MCHRFHPDIDCLTHPIFYEFIAVFFLYITKLNVSKDTKLDVLNILANVAGGSKKSIAEVRVALGGVSEWFDEYIATEEADPGEVYPLHIKIIQ